MKVSKRSIYIIVLILVNIAADQISKFWIRAQVEAGSRSSIIGEVFTLHNVENKGAFLGMGSDLNPVLKVLLLWLLPIAVLIMVLRHILKDTSMDKLSLIAFCCIIGGGVANVYDRIIYGSVTDFLHIDLGGSLRTGIFNIADISVTGGMILLLVAALVNYKKNKANA